MSDKKIKTYMLFLYGVWLDSQFITKVASNILLPLRSEGLVKFVNGSLSSVITFSSEFTIDDIYDKINKELPDLVNMIFLMEKPEQIRYRLPEWLEKHLFDINTYDENSPYIIKGGDAIGENNPSDPTPDMSIELEIPDGDDINQIMKDFTDAIDDMVSKKNPTFAEANLDLDDILDKVSKSGLDSLTKREKAYLDKYNK